jgi:hypothetical protein
MLSMRAMLSKKKTLKKEARIDQLFIKKEITYKRKFP